MSEKICEIWDFSFLNCFPFCGLITYRKCRTLEMNSGVNVTAVTPMLLLKKMTPPKVLMPFSLSVYRSPKEQPH